MKQWYYADNDAKHGPVSTEEVTRFLEQGRLNADSLVWCDGMDEWQPVRQIPDFQLSPYTPPSAEILGDVVWDPSAPTGPQVRPWIRFWARTFDLVTFAMIVGAVLEFTAPAVLEMHDTAYNILLSVVAIPIEAAVFAIFGTTPGKALLNIRVRNRDASKLGFNRALARSFSVWLRGQGIGIPLATLIANIIAYRNLSSRGVTTWDADSGFVVTHRSIEFWRVLILLALFAGVVALAVVGSEAAF